MQVTHLIERLVRSGAALLEPSADISWEDWTRVIETLILEAMEGDHTLFTREDEVEEAWRVLMPVLDYPPPVEFYEPGSWGPPEADALVLPRHWHVTPPPEERPTSGR